MGGDSEGWDRDGRVRIWMPPLAGAVPNGGDFLILRARGDEYNSYERNL
jgi:hypothetical protein